MSTPAATYRPMGLNPNQQTLPNNRSVEATGLRKRQLRLLECRHKRADNAQLEWHWANGRPKDTWRVCGKQECTNEPCLFKDVSVSLVAYDRDDDNLSVMETYDAYVSRASHKIAGSREIEEVHVAVYQAVKSFLQSPPVQCAYCLFKMSCAELGIDLQYTQAATLRDTIRNAAHRLGRILDTKSTVDDYVVVHRHHTMLNLGCRLRDWSLEDMVMRYLTSIEMWRRSEAGKQRAWSFGDTEESYDILGSTLLQFWQMDMVGSFEVDRQLTTKRWTTIWEEWIAQFPVRKEDGLGSIESEARHFNSDAPSSIHTEMTYVTEVLGYLAGHGQRALGTMNGLF